MFSFQIGCKSVGAKLRKGPFYSKLQIVAKTPNIQIINLNCLRWSPKMLWQKKRGSWDTKAQHC